MSLWLFNVYMDGVVREVKVRVLGKGLELLSANCGRFKINQLLCADDTLSGRTGSALAWRSEGRTFASQSVQ